MLLGVQRCFDVFQFKAFQLSCSKTSTSSQGVSRYSKLFWGVPMSSKVFTGIPSLQGDLRCFKVSQGAFRCFKVFLPNRRQAQLDSCCRKKPSSNARHSSQLFYLPVHTALLKCSSAQMYSNVALLKCSGLDQLSRGRAPLILWRVKTPFSHFVPCWVLHSTQRLHQVTSVQEIHSAICTNHFAIHTLSILIVS